MEHPLTFEHQFDALDWIAFSVYHMQCSRAHRRRRFWLRFGVVPVAAIFIVGSLWGRAPDPGLALVFAITAMVWFFAYPKVYDHSNLKRIRKVVADPENAKLFGRRTTTLTSEHVHQRWAGGESTIAWGSVIKIAGSEDYIFIYISTVEAIVIPRMSLKGVSFDDLRAKLAEYYRATHTDRSVQLCMDEKMRCTEPG